MSLRAIERAFAEIAALADALSDRVRDAERGTSRAARKMQVFDVRWQPRVLKLTPKRRAQLKLQGKYMGYMRQLKPAQKARVRAVKEKRGFAAAITLARKIAKA